MPPPIQVKPQEAAQTCRSQACAVATARLASRTVRQCLCPTHRAEENIAVMRVVSTTTMSRTSLRSSARP
eukprot:6645382-Alexandrium_andersonii.AAC.1